jgi:hypothetical protein
MFYLRQMVLIKTSRSIVINYLEKLCADFTTSIAYVYFSYEEKENRSVVNIVGSLLRQLVQRKGVIPDQIMALYNDHSRRKTRLKLTDITKLLHSECLSVLKTFIVIDALDECSVHNDARESFINELSKLPQTTRLLLTSRPDAKITHRINDTIQLEIQATNTDVANYIEMRLEEDLRLKHHVEGDAELKAAIISKLVQNARGLYVPHRLQ